jgi:hypothetical protein
MRTLLAEVRAAMPFQRPEARSCAGECRGGCAPKLLDYLEGELDDWARRLDAGDVPDFGDLARLEQTSRKIYRALRRNGLVE